MSAERKKDEDFLRLHPEAGGALVLEHFKLADTVRLEPGVVKSIADYWNANQAAAKSGKTGGKAYDGKAVKLQKPMRKPRAGK